MNLCVILIQRIRIDIWLRLFKQNSVKLKCHANIQIQIASNKKSHFRVEKQGQLMKLLSNKEKPHNKSNNYSILFDSKIDKDMNLELKQITSSKRNKASSPKVSQKNVKSKLTSLQDRGQGNDKNADELIKEIKKTFEWKINQLNKKFLKTCNKTQKKCRSMESIQSRGLEVLQSYKDRMKREKTCQAYQQQQEQVQNFQDNDNMDEENKRQLHLSRSEIEQIYRKCKQQQHLISTKLEAINYQYEQNQSDFNCSFKDIIKSIQSLHSRMTHIMQEQKHQQISQSSIQSEIYGFIITLKKMKKIYLRSQLDTEFKNKHQINSKESSEKSREMGLFLNPEQMNKILSLEDKGMQLINVVQGIQSQMNSQYVKFQHLIESLNKFIVKIDGKVTQCVQEQEQNCNFNRSNQYEANQIDADQTIQENQEYLVLTKQSMLIRQNQSFNKQPIIHNQTNIHLEDLAKKLTSSTTEFKPFQLKFQQTDKLEKLQEQKNNEVEIIELSNHQDQLKNIVKPQSQLKSQHQQLQFNQSSLKKKTNIVINQLSPKKYKNEATQHQEAQVGHQQHSEPPHVNNDDCTKLNITSKPLQTDKIIDRRQSMLLDGYENEEQTDNTLKICQEEQPISFQCTLPKITNHNIPIEQKKQPNHSSSNQQSKMLNQMHQVNSTLDDKILTKSANKLAEKDKVEQIFNNSQLPLDGNTSHQSNQLENKPTITKLSQNQIHKNIQQQNKTTDLHTLSTPIIKSFQQIIQSQREKEYLNNKIQVQSSLQLKNDSKRSVNKYTQLLNNKYINLSFNPDENTFQTQTNPNNQVIEIHSKRYGKRQMETYRQLKKISFKNQPKDQSVTSLKASKSLNVLPSYQNQNDLHIALNYQPDFLKSTQLTNEQSYSVDRLPLDGKFSSHRPQSLNQMLSSRNTLKNNCYDTLRKQKLKFDKIKHCRFSNG